MKLSRQPRKGSVKGASLSEIEVVHESQFVAFLRTASAITGNLEAGRDAVHSAFVLAIRSRETFRAAGSLEAWLWKIVVNTARKERLRAQRDTWEEFDVGQELEAQSDRGVSPFATSRSLREAVSALPDRQRLALFLRYYADLDYSTIAAVLEIDPGTVGSSLNAARGAMREHLAKEGITHR